MVESTNWLIWTKILLRGNVVKAFYIFEQQTYFCLHNIFGYIIFCESKCIN